jgi:hypothetical protein
MKIHKISVLIQTILALNEINFNFKEVYFKLKIDNKIVASKSCLLLK